VLTSHRITAEALRRWNAYQASPSESPIPADLRSPVYRAAIKNDPQNAVLALKKEWFTTPAIDGKELCLTALGHAPDEAVVRDVVIPFLFNTSPPAHASDSVPGADMHILAGSLANNRTGRPLLWQFLRDHWDKFEAKLAGNPILVDRMVRVSLPKFTDYETLEEIEKFFAQRSTKGFDRTLEQVKDTIRGRAAYKVRDVEGVRGWLVEHGYA
jgi:aminopeptidase N